MVSSGSVLKLKVPGQEWWEQCPGHASAMSSMEGPPLAMCPSLFFLLPEITLSCKGQGLYISCSSKVCGESPNHDYTGKKFVPFTVLSCWMLEKLLIRSM